MNLETLPKIRADTRKQRYLRQCEKEKIAWRSLSLIQKYFVYTPIGFPGGRKGTISRVVPSGTAFTQFIDSIVNCIYISLCSENQARRIMDLNVVLGENSRLTAFHFDLQACNDLEILGAKAHPEKCTIVREPHKFETPWFDPTV